MIRNLLQGLVNMQGPYQQMAPSQPMQQRENEYEFFRPQNDMQNRFAGLLDNMPQPNKPSVWRKLGASLAGLGKENGYETAQSIAYAPYLRELSEWKMRAPFMQQAADNERLTNQQGLTFNNQMRTQQFNERKQDEVERKNQSTESLNREKEERANKLAELKIWQAQNPNVKFQVVDGTLYALNPADGKAVDTGVKGLSKMEELQFTANAAMDRVNAQQTGAMNRTVVQQEGATERAGLGGTPFNQVNPDGSTSSVFINRTGQASPITGINGPLQRPAAPPRATNAGVLSPTQQRQLQVTRANQLKNQDPALGQFITIGPNGIVTVAEPRRGLFGGQSGPTEEQRKRIMEVVFGTGGLNINQPQSTTPTSTPQVRRQTSPSTGKTRVSTDGGKTWRIE